MAGQSSVSRFAVHRRLLAWMSRVEVGIDHSHEQIRRVHEELEESVSRLSMQLDRLWALSAAAQDHEPEHRRRLYELRRSSEYEAAFTEEEPLVSVVVPTYDRFESLRNVALPSLLGQAYENIEVVVVGDGAPPETAAVIKRLGDPRVRYFNRTVRGPYPDDPADRWKVVGTPAYNDGIALARGRWIGGLGDDDAVRPEHTASLVAAAQEHRYEHCYGRLQVHFPGGEPIEIGVFPPELAQFGLQASIYHAGLRYFGMPMIDAVRGEPNDWSLGRRMLEAGVQFGMIDGIVVDKFETRHGAAEDWHRGEAPHITE